MVGGRTSAALLGAASRTCSILLTDGLPNAMNDREGCRDRVKDIRADGMAR